MCIYSTNPGITRGGEEFPLSYNRFTKGEQPVAALTGEGHVGRIYDLTGPEALTHGEMAEKLSSALNHQIQYVDIGPQTMMDALLGFGLPQWQAEGLVEDYAHYRRGEAAVIATGVHDAVGSPPRSFDQFALDYAPAFC